MAPTRFARLPLKTKAYVVGVTIAGAATVLQSFYALATHPIGWNWAILAILTLASGSATVRLPSLPATISVSETFVFTSVLLFGSAAGTLTVALDALVISFWSYRKGQPSYKILFNVCALPLTIWVAAHLFFAFPNMEPLVDGTLEQPLGMKALVVPLLAFTVTYFLLNSWIITFAISLEKSLRPLTVWRENFLWLSLNYFGGASVAALLVGYTKDVDFTYLAVIIPLLIVLYLTFSVSMGRVEDANRHLTQLNTLYMSTIETLAMAIDAKDQITHGHIRRVQTYAVALAKEVGVKDDLQIRAIEAAALLHDMGKLAVPEYILNKPGPLTAAEFEKMKMHASVGADILSSIDFPYPVVPIVRHHHENWDGTGYPDGIRSTDIPVGARILSVVDCFDALTSDRPYRPRLPEKEALRILLERRGTMYDPWIVDTFVRVHTEIAPRQDDGSSSHALAAVTDSGSTIPSPEMRSLDEIVGSAEEMLILFDLSKELSNVATQAECGSVVCKYIRRLVPCSICVVYVYDVKGDELVAWHADGVSAHLVEGMRVTLGQRLSGWVAANRQAIRNSDAALDLGDLARSATPRLRKCLSAPIVANDTLVGTVTLYSTAMEGFTENHQRLTEIVSRQVSCAVHKWSTVSSQGGASDRATSLESSETAHFLGDGQTPVPAIVVSFQSAIGPSVIPQGSDDVLVSVALLARHVLPSSALLIRVADNCLAAVVLCAGQDASEAGASRLRQSMVALINGQALSPHISVGIARIPEHGSTIRQALSYAMETGRSGVYEGDRNVSEPPNPVVH